MKRLFRSYELESLQTSILTGDWVEVIEVIDWSDWDGLKKFFFLKDLKKNIC